MGIRNYSNTGQTSTLSAGIGATDVSITLTGYAGDPSPPFTAALARGTATEEIVLVTAVAGSTVTVTRGYDGTAAQAQGAGNTFQEVVVAQDFREANNHVNATSAAHGITGGFVGTTDTQTLTNKTLTSPTLSGATLNGTSTIATANVTTLTVTGVTTLASVVATTITASGLITANAGLTAPTGQHITVTDAPVNGTDAANKAYVDGKTKTSAQISDATAAPTASTVVIRDASGRAQVATPAATGDIATKGYADAVGTSAATASTVVKRDASSRAQFADPAAAQDAATKNYVDTKPLARARRVTNQSIPTNSFTTVVFDTVDIDTLGTQYATTGLTIRAAGYYRVSAGFTAAPAATSGRRAVVIYKGATSLKIGRLTPAPIAEAGIECSGIVQLAVGDVLTIQVYQDSGSPQNTDSTSDYGQTYLEAEFLRP